MAYGKVTAMMFLLLQFSDNLIEGDGITRARQQSCTGFNFVNVDIDTKPGEIILNCSNTTGLKHVMLGNSDYFRVDESSGSVYLNRSLQFTQDKSIELTINAADATGMRRYNFTVHISIKEDISIYVYVGNFSNGIVTNGSDVEVFCRVQGMTAKPIFSFFLSGRRIQMTRSNRFHLTVSQPSGDWLATFRFRPILLRDTGQFMCVVSGVDQIPYKSATSISVVTPTEVSVNPPFVHVKEGQNVNLTCSVSPKSSSGILTWYRDYVALANIEAQSTQIATSLTFSTPIVTRNVLYVCEFLDTQLAKSLKMVQLTYYSKDTVTCSEEVDNRGGMWPESPVGRIVTAKCQLNYTGESTRSCLVGGIWGQTDYDTNCGNTILVLLLDRAQDLKDGYTDGNISAMLIESANEMDPSHMTSKDIDLVLDILEIISDTYTTKETVAASWNRLESCLTVGDVILQIQLEKWKKLKDLGLRGPKSLLQSMDFMVERTMADMSSSITGDYNVTYMTDTIFFQMASVINREMEFPISGKTPSWLGEQTASVQRTNNSDRVWFSGVIYRDLTKAMDAQIIDKMQIEDNLVEIRDDVNNVIVNAPTPVEVVSRAVSFHLYPKPTTLSSPIYLTFQIDRDGAQPVCSYLNYSDSTYSSGVWESRSCAVVSYVDDIVVCGCNHTTNFAILMSPVQPNPTDTFILSIISIVGISISLFFLLLTIIIYCFLWRYLVKTHVARIKSVLLMHLCALLIISYTLFLVGAELVQNKDVCTAVAALLHYFFLAVFFVMLAEGIHLFISIIIVLNFTSYLNSLLIMVWVTPAIIVGVTLGVVKPEGYTGQRFCWLSTSGNILWAFVAPVLFIIVVNFLILLVSLRKMFHRKRAKILTDDKIKQGRYIARALGVILPIIGVTWIIGVFAINRDVVVFQYIFAVCNSLQGVFIFIFHCCTSNVRVAFQEMRRRRKRMSLSASSGMHVGRKISSNLSMSTDKTNSYVLSFSTDSLRMNEEINTSRVIALPTMYDISPDIQRQQLIADQGSHMIHEYANIEYSSHTGDNSTPVDVNKGVTESRERYAARQKWKEAIEAIRAAKSYHVTPSGSQSSYNISPPSSPSTVQSTLMFHIPQLMENPRTLPTYDLVYHF